MSRYARWHGDGLILEAEDLPSLVLSRRGNEVAYEVSVGKTSRKADPNAPTTLVEGIFGVYDMVSGPFVALVLESAPAFDVAPVDDADDLLAGTRSLRRVVKIGLAPLFRDGRRLNSRVKADEVLQTRLLTKTFAAFPFVFSFDSPSSATRASSLNPSSSLKKKTHFADDEEDGDDVDDDDAGAKRQFYLLDGWDHRFLWNRKPLEKILQSIANQGEPRAYGWCLRCCAAACSSGVRDGVEARAVTRLSCRSLGRGVDAYHDDDSSTLGRNFAETEIVVTNEDGAAVGCIFARSERNPTDLGATVDKLLGAYGGDFVTVVDVMDQRRHLDPAWKRACAELASLTRGAKLRHVVGGQQPEQCLVGSMSMNPPRALAVGRDNGDDDQQKRTTNGSGSFVPGIALFCGADDDVDRAICTSAAACLLRDLRSTAAKAAGKAALDICFSKHDAKNLRGIVADPPDNLALLPRLKALVFAALFDGSRDDGIDLLLGGAKTGNKKQRSRARPFIPAETPVYPLDLVDAIAFKTIVLLVLIFLPVYFTAGDHIPLSAVLSCTFCILAQTLALVFAKSILDGSLLSDLAHRRRILPPPT